MAANQGLRITLHSIDQQRDRSSRLSVRRYYRGVAKQTSPLRSRESSATKPRAKNFVARDRQYFCKIESRSDAGFGTKLRPPGLGREPIEWTHVLADVASEDPVADSRSQLARNRTGVLNCQIGYATPRIQSVRSGGRSKSTRISDRKNHEPFGGCKRLVFFPKNPVPALAATARSSSGTASTKHRARTGRAASCSITLASD